MELGQKEIATGEKINKIYYAQEIREKPSDL